MVPIQDETLSADGEPRSEGVAVQAGTVLAGRYELLEELGRGAHAVVFRAHDAAAGTEVAIKVLGSARQLSQVAVERLRRELRAAWAVTHPGVVRIHDLIPSSPLALSMELVAGETLDRVLARAGRLGAAELGRLARELASALAAAHAVGVTHRDLKPSNIMIRAATGRAVITDLGLSRIAGIAEAPSAPSPAREDPDLTRTGDLVGTPAFMAPEQLRGGGDVGPGADVYALGLVLFEAATGTRPHAHDKLPELVRARLERAAPPVASLRADLPARLAQTIDACLAIDPARRIADGGALERVLDEREAAARRARWRWAAALLVVLAAATVAVQLRGRARAVPHVPSLPGEHATFARFASGPVAMTLAIPSAHAGIVQRTLRDDAGNLLVAGHTIGSFTIDGQAVSLTPGIRSGYLLALAPDGRLLWQRALTGTNDVQVVDMARTGGAVVVVGAHHGPIDLGGGVHVAAPAHQGDPDCYIAAFDERDGSARWAHRCGATGGFGQAHGVAADASGDVVMVGEFSGTASFGGELQHSLAGDGRGLFAARYGPHGELRWVSTSDDALGNARGFAVALRGREVFFGGLITHRHRFAGVELAAATSGDGDGFLIVLDAETGSVRRTRQLHGSGLDSVSTIALGPAGEIVVGGAYSGTAELVPGRPVTAIGLTDSFVARIDPITLTPMWATVGGSRQDDGIRDLAWGAHGVVAIGRYNLDFELAGRHLDGRGNVDGYLAELDGETGAVRTLEGVGSSAAERLRTVAIEADGSIRITGTLWPPVDFLGVPVRGEPKQGGFVVLLRPLPR